MSASSSDAAYTHPGDFTAEVPKNDVEDGSPS